MLFWNLRFSLWVINSLLTFSPAWEPRCTPERIHPRAHPETHPDKLVISMAVTFKDGVILGQSALLPAPSTYLSSFLARLPREHLANRPPSTQAPTLAQQRAHTSRTA